MNMNSEVINMILLFLAFVIVIMFILGAIADIIYNSEDICTAFVNTTLYISFIFGFIYIINHFNITVS